MKYIDEYREKEAVSHFSRAIFQATTKPWTIMEVCGGQTHAIVKFGLEELLPPEITLIHGPGCPVCVTSIELIDKAHDLALRTEITFCSFGDMLRVPGSKGDLFSAKAKGADVRMVYSPLDALDIARKSPEKEVVFFAVGFETTAPTTAMTIYRAYQEEVPNFSVLVSHVLVPPAMECILTSESNQVEAFLAAGHVCTIMGCAEYGPLAEKYKVPIVVTGFEPLDILQGIYMCVKQCEASQHYAENQYSRSVRDEGNRRAQEIITEVFEVADQKWRGIGNINASGLALRTKYSALDAIKRFNIPDYQIDESTECKSGLVLQGLIKPYQCPAFGKSCTPEHPLGATMVSTEGACAAYYRYRNH